ncbi:MAG: amidohydrolase family protein, partial [Candidatus Omnitrophota bacterium]|nr:amidohydrolase family protein [Candidatus Omnitrophota bacterium]
MTSVYIENGRVILEDRIVDNATIKINGGRILGVGRWPQFKKRLPAYRPSASPRGEQGRWLRPPRFARGSRNDEIKIIDAKGCFVSPGFIDCHIHGEPEKIFFNEARHGMTAFVAAESCAPLKYIYKRAKNLKEFIRTHPFGPNLLGLRLEGPYISKAKAGAQDTAHIKKPDAKELSSVIDKCGGFLKIMTIAPELKDAIPLIRLLRKHKIIASVGHSDATYERAVGGIDAGIAHCTHIFNAMSPLDRRDPGVV